MMVPSLFLPLVHRAGVPSRAVRGRSVLPAGRGDGIRLPPRGVGDDWSIHELRHTLVDVMHLRPVHYRPGRVSGSPSGSGPLEPPFVTEWYAVSQRTLCTEYTLVLSRGCGPSAPRRPSGAAASHAAETVRGDSFTLQWSHLPLVYRIHVPGPQESAPPFRDINPRRCVLLS